MADLSGLLEDAVYDIYSADSVLVALVGGRIKHGRASAGWTTPYVTYSFPNLPAGNTFKKNNPSVFSISIYFDIFSNNDFYMTEVSPIASLIRSDFDGVSVSLDGFNDTILKLSNESPVEQEDTGLWHMQLHYSGKACAT
jgi:hypothetical protein